MNKEMKKIVRPKRISRHTVVRTANKTVSPELVRAVAEAKVDRGDYVTFMAVGC